MSRADTNPTALSSNHDRLTHRRLFVGCVRRPVCHRHRAQAYPPRNTPEPMSRADTNPWSVRGAGFTTSPS